MLSAVIFDMDGVLIDSEPFWQRAQVAVFAEVGSPITFTECEQTIGMRIDQLVAYRYQRQPWSGHTQAEVAERIVQRVIDLIKAEGEAKCGVLTTLEAIKAQGLKIGLATSSPSNLLHAVLNKLEIAPYFEAVHSAENERFGKPHPDVYIHAAEKLGVAPIDCLAIEDSLTGLLAAKAASMKALIVPDPSLQQDPRLAIADARVECLSQFTSQLLHR